MVALFCLKRFKVQFLNIEIKANKIVLLFEFDEIDDLRFVARQNTDFW